MSRCVASKNICIAFCVRSHSDAERSYRTCYGAAASSMYSNTGKRNVLFPAVVADRALSLHAAVAHVADPARAAAPLALAAARWLQGRAAASDDPVDTCPRGASIRNSHAPTDPGYARPAGRQTVAGAGGPGRAIDELKGGERERGPGRDRDETGGSMRELWRICACRPRYLRPGRCDPPPLTGADRTDDRAAGCRALHAFLGSGAWWRAAQVSTPQPGVTPTRAYVSAYLRPVLSTYFLSYNTIHSTSRILFIRSAEQPSY